MIDSDKWLLFYVIFGCLIKLYSSVNLQPIDECTQWNSSEPNLIFDDMNNTDNSFSLDLLNSGLDINRQTGEIAVLDDGNHRVLIFDPLNTSVLLAVLSDSSNSTNKSTISNSPSAITFDRNNSFYVLDYNGVQKQLMTINMNIKYGRNATTNNTSSFNGTVGGLCKDNRNDRTYVSVSNLSQVMCWGLGCLSLGNGTAGNSSSQLNNPQSIVIDENQTL